MAHAYYIATNKNATPTHRTLLAKASPTVRFRGKRRWDIVPLRSGGGPFLAIYCAYDFVQRAPRWRIFVDITYIDKAACASRSITRGEARDLLKRYGFLSHRVRDDVPSSNNDSK